MEQNDETHHKGTKENGDRIEFGVGNHVCVYSPKRGIWVVGLAWLKLQESVAVRTCSLRAAGC